jgi:uncharacterized protein YyaL (SSP411 family)
MNLLQDETSPYLLQHANNPVHWMPWGEEPFIKAKEENKPILISIGYSSCHWCHVMAHESFEDEETANLMNQLFINVKIDREEYPDVDHLYMDAVQAMTGSGGWPLNVFVTPDKKAFYGGTYFPPKRMHSRAAWKEILINVSQYFQQNRNEVETQADKLLTHLNDLSQLTYSAKDENELHVPAEETCHLIAKKILAQADTEEGGFGTAPKFPSTFSIQYLLDHYALFNDENAIKQVKISLDKMMMGGIYDQIGGGFSRYSTDRYWQSPHFEKMLYDNALLLEVYASAYQVTKEEKYRFVIEQTIEWLQREMLHKEGGFFSAQDADSEGVEGKYYTWQCEEVKTILGDDYIDFAEYYQLSEIGNWEHTNILWTNYDLQAKASNLFFKKLPQLHEALLKVRMKRIKPLTDDKILLSWNALLCKALVKCGTLLNNSQYLLLAKNNLDFLLHKFSSKNSLYYHTYKDGIAKIPAYLDDLAYLADACIAVSQAHANTFYTHQAIEILKYIQQHFSAKANHLFYFTNQQFMQVEVAKQDIYDGALPSANAVICKLAYYLGHASLNVSWQTLSSSMWQQMQSSFQKYPASFAVWANQFQLQHIFPKEITLLGDKADLFYQQIYTDSYRPNILFITNKMFDAKLNLIANQSKTNEMIFRLCQENVCLPQFDKLDDLLLAIK